MEMYNRNRTNRVGIYTQKSAEATAAGEGFAPRGEESPVASSSYNQYGNMNSHRPQYSGNMSQQGRSRYGSNPSNRETNGSRPNEYRPRPYDALERGFHSAGLRQQRPLNTGQNYREEYHSQPSTSRQQFSAQEDQDADNYEEVPRPGSAASSTETYIEPLGILPPDWKKPPDLPYMKKPAPGSDCLVFTSPAIRAGHTSVVCDKEWPDEADSDNADTRYPIEVQVLNRSTPMNVIEEKYHSLLIDTLQSLLENVHSNGRPEIEISENIHFHQMHLVVHCKNEATVNYLQANIHLFNKLMQNADLYVNKNISTSYKRMKLTLQNYKLRPEEVLRIIKKQNNYPTELWKLISYTVNLSDTFLVFAIDTDSYERLLRNDESLFFFFSKLGVSLK